MVLLMGEIYEVRLGMTLYGMICTLSSMKIVIGAPARLRFCVSNFRGRTFGIADGRDF
jgi:hypothetical protein